MTQILYVGIVGLIATAAMLIRPFDGHFGAIIEHHRVDRSRSQSSSLDETPTHDFNKRSKFEHQIFNSKSRSTYIGRVEEDAIQIGGAQVEILGEIDDIVLIGVVATHTDIVT